MLRHFQRRFQVCPVSLGESDLLNKAKKEMGVKLYNMAVRVFTEYVGSIDESVSAGYFKFAFVIGESGQAPKKDVDYLWNRMVEVYGDEKRSVDHIKRVLGTICMMVVADDPRNWVYRDDMDKKFKIAQGQVPEATEYWVVL